MAIDPTTPEDLSELRRLWNEAAPSIAVTCEMGSEYDDMRSLRLGMPAVFVAMESNQSLLTKLRSILSLPESATGDEIVVAVEKLKAENAILKRSIEAFGNNPAGFDWEVLHRVEELEDEVERLRAACSEAGLMLTEVLDRHDGELTGPSRGDVDNVRLDLLLAAEAAKE